MSNVIQAVEEATKDFGPIDLEQLIDGSISKPARYMGNELGVEPKQWEEAKVRWALTYPEIYEVGASNLGHIILYSILNTIPNQLCDRCYLPAPDLTKKLRKQSIPLFAVESKRPLWAFDILGFSLSYELGATNILEMLNLAWIELYAKNRNNLSINDPNAPPLIFAGGPSATSNPEPFAAFFDFFALGDGEELLPEIGLLISKCKKSNLKRSELLEELSLIPGVYVPSLYKKNKNNAAVHPVSNKTKQKIIRRVATPMPMHAMGLVPYIETVHDRLTIEIRRGCTRGCRFCQPGMITRPARDVDPNEVIKAVESGMEKTGYSDFSLLSLSCSDYLALPSVGVELRNRLADKNVSLQLPSQRIDRFNEDIAHILGGTRKSGLTFAPEAGTQRLRDIINKGLTDKDLINGIRQAMQNGYKKIKLYFMIGLPGETDDDVLGISETCLMLRKECSDLGKLKLNITISNFTPKPHTPFQWHSVSTNELARRQDLLKSSFLKMQGIKANFTDLRISFMEDFVGRGDRRIASVIKRAWEMGAGMDAWFESTQTAYDAWSKAIHEAGLESDYRELEIGNWSNIESLSNHELMDFCSQPLPWDHIDTGIDKKWLAEDLKRALNQNPLEDCSFGSCSKCGVCGPELGHNEIISPPPIPKDRKKESLPIKKISRIRISFCKEGAMRFIGHLDLMRLFERSLRRSNLPVSYSAGYHPLPRLQIALALPLGIEAFGEWMDIDFAEKVIPQKMLKSLQSVLPEGIKLISAESIPVNSKSLAQSLKQATWSFQIYTTSTFHPTKSQFEEAIASLLKAKELFWIDKDKKGRVRKRDCRQDLLDLKVKYKSSPNNQSLPQKEILIQLETSIDEMGRSLKPKQIQYWLEEYLGHPLKITNIKRDKLILFKC